MLTPPLFDLRGESPPKYTGRHGMPPPPAARRTLDRRDDVPDLGHLRLHEPASVHTAQRLPSDWESKQITSD